MDRREFRELVDTPRERLDVEYKAWMDLRDGSVRAKVARHICALANHGGGYLVFGINDDMVPSGARPESASSYDQDTVTGIVKKYLVPAFQVRVHEVRASTGIVHPVVWVPPHGTVPICSKKSGPDGGSGRREIVQGTHYARGPGPASEPVTTAELWAPIIRRCVRHDRQSLLAAFDGVLRPRDPTVDADASLRRWHEAARTGFLEAAAGDREEDKIRRAHFQLSYRIATLEGEQLEMSGFVDELRQINHEVRQLVDTGWPMFVLFDLPDLRPRSASDESSGVDEYLQCRLVGAARENGGIPELWRVAPGGLATLVRAYHLEDFSGADQGSLASGTWLWPQGVASDLAKLIRHAYALSKRFETGETIMFRAEWWGLAGRRLDAPGVPWLRSGRDVATDDNCVATATVPVAELRDGWQSVVAGMLSRVFRMFNAEMSVSAQQIDAWSKEFRR